MVRRLIPILATGLLSGCVISLGDWPEGDWHGSDWHGAHEREVRQAMVEGFDGSGALRVETVNGNIAVTLSEGPPEVRAEIRAQTKERLEQTVVLADTQVDGTLFVHVEWPGGERRSNEGCSFEIKVPGANGVTLRTSNGVLTMEGLSGTARLDSSNGSITVRRHAGSLQARTSNGSVKLRKVEGEVDARSSNGRIEVLDAAAAVSVHTSNGRLEIRLTPQNAGPVNASTSNGSVELAIGAAFTGELRLDTSNGRVRFDGAPPAGLLSLDKTFAHLQFGEGGPASSVETSNGSIEVSLAGE
ncbi:MAG: DUF4097 family beta strand repeat-containing protein [Planctomycetota bacterium]